MKELNTATLADKSLISAIDTKLTMLDSGPYKKYEQNYQCFPDDVVGYFDFSHVEKPGYNFSGRNHLDVCSGPGVEQIDDIRKGIRMSLPYGLQGGVPFGEFNEVNSKPSGLISTTLAENFDTISFSTSFWIKPDKFSQSNLPSVIWTCNDPLSPATGTRLTTSNKSVKIYIQTIASLPSLVLQCRNGATFRYTGMINIAMNVWTHITITTNGLAGGVKFYKNSVLTPSIAHPSFVASFNGTFNMNDNVKTHFMVGCDIPNIFDDENKHEFNYIEQYFGSLSDLLLVNRELTAPEVVSLFNDDYGYSCIVIGGQSNGVGAALTVAGIDDNYTKLENRVYAYSTANNIGGGNTIINSIVAPAQNTLPFPGASTTTTGFWRTFCEDYIKYMNLPVKRKVMIIPVAVSGSAMVRWSPPGIGSATSQEYNRMIAAVNHAISLNKLNNLDLMLWNQGESDIANTNSATENLYKTYLYGMFEQLYTSDDCAPFKFRKDLPRILAEVSGPFYSQYNSTFDGVLLQAQYYINDTMKDLVTMNNAYTVPNAFQFVDTKELTYHDNGVHYDSESLNILGHKYFDSFMKSLEAKYTNSEIVNLKPDGTGLSRKIKDNSIIVTDVATKVLKSQTIIPEVFRLSRVIGSGGTVFFDVNVDYVQFGYMLMIKLSSVVFTVGSVDTHYITALDELIPENLIPDGDVIIPNVILNGTSITSGYWYFDAENRTLMLKQNVGAFGLFEIGETYTVSEACGCYITTNVLA